MAGVTKVNIRNPDGTPGFGFVKDGATYKDEAATQRIDEGTKVSVGGKLYTYNGPGAQTTVQNPTAKANPGVTQVNIRNPDGTPGFGFVKDGVTYTTPELKDRVSNGTMVHTAGGVYKMTSDGGVPTTPTILNKYQDSTQKYMDIYKASQEATERRIDANVQAAVNRLSDQKYDVEKQRKEAEKAAYSAYRAAVNPYGARAQQLASMGLSDSGYSETSLLNLGNQYQKAISDAFTARNEALRAIELQIEEARLSGDAQKAEALVAYHQNVANMGLQNAQYYTNLAVQLSQAAQNSDIAAEERAYAREQDAYAKQQDKKNEYMAWIQMGIVPSDAAAVLGIPQTEINALAAYYKAQRASGRVSGGYA